jgi:hypothetical protein
MAPKALPVALLLLAAALAGCSSSTSDDGSSSGGTGSASAYVKDKPSDDFREVHLVFTQVSVHRSAAGSENETSTTAAGTATGVSTTVGNTTISASATASATATSTAQEAGWVVVFSDAAGVDVDLLNTTGAKAAFLGEADLAAGHYQQVRVTVKEAYGVYENGTRADITVSSGTVKSVKSFEVESGKETRITIDLDLERSLHQQGNGQWRMSPVIGKTSAAVVDDEDSGEEQAQPGDVEDVPESA